MPEQGVARVHSVALSVLELTDCESAVLTRVALAGSASREPDSASEWSSGEIADAVDTLAEAGLVSCTSGAAVASGVADLTAAIAAKANAVTARADALGAAQREALQQAILRRTEGPLNVLGRSGDIEGEFLAVIQSHRLVIHSFPSASFQWPNQGEIDQRALDFDDALGPDQLCVAIVSAPRLRIPREASFFRASEALPRCTVSVSDGVQMRLTLLDDRAAVVPIDPHDHNAGALVIRDPDAVAQVATQIAMLLATARPLAPEAPVTCALSEREAAVVRFLSAGLTDESIARRLRVTDRTIRRTVAELMSKVGADSRFALAVACARQGLL